VGPTKGGEDPCEQSVTIGDHEHVRHTCGHVTKCIRQFGNTAVSTPCHGTQFRKGWGVRASDRHLCINIGFDDESLRPVTRGSFCIENKFWESVVLSINPLKPKLVRILFKYSVRTSKRTLHFTITKINWLTLFKFNPLKPKFVRILFKYLVRTSKRTPHFTITKINWLTLFKFNPLKPKLV
jgi:hypothetical protein